MMRSRTKHVHVTIILMVCFDIFLTFGGYASALNTENELWRSGGGIGFGMGGKGGGDSDGDYADSNDLEEGDPPDRSGEKQVTKDSIGEFIDDPVLSEKDIQVEDNADYGTSIPTNLNQYICLVKWGHVNGKVLPDQLRFGQYDTLGTIISRRAVIASPPGILVPTITEENSDLTTLLVKSILFNLFNNGRHYRLGTNKLELYFHPKFSLKRDTAHHFIIIYLTEDLPPEAGIEVPLLVTNPMSKYNWYKMSQRDNDDYAITRCEMIAYNKNPGNDREIIQINMVLTKCTHQTSPETKEMWENRMCGRFRMVGGDVRHLAERLGNRFNDVGNPLFCYGSFVGMYMGIQNIRGNFYEDRGYVVDSLPDVVSPFHQFTFEIPGTEENYKFIRSVTSEQEGLRFGASYAAFDDSDKCLDEGVALSTRFDPQTPRNTWVPGGYVAPSRNKNKLRGELESTTVGKKTAVKKAAASLSPGTLLMTTLVVTHILLVSFGAGDWRPL